MKKTLFALLAMLLLPLSSFAGGSTLYPWLTDYSFTGISSWSQPLIASGTSLPADANAHPGDLFINTATSTAPTLWRRGATTWVQMSGAAASGGVSTHSLLLGLSFADSGHTGFNSAASHTLHVEDQTDPHGASMTVSEKVTIGSGPADVQIYHIATGVVGIATDVYVVGKVGIGTSTPQAALHNTGFSLLGESAPKLKCKLLTGTTPSAVASYTLVAHGLTSSTFVSINGLVFNEAGTGVTTDFSRSGTETLHSAVSFSTNYIQLDLDANATGLLSKPFRVLIWYTE